MSVPPEPNAIGLLVFPLAIIALLVFLIEGRKRSWSVWLWLTLGLLVAAFLLSALWNQSQYRGVPSAQAGRYADPSQDPRFVRQPQISPIPPPPKGYPTETTPPAAKPAVEETVKPVTPTDKPGRPDWMNQPPSKQGEVYVVPIDSGVYADPSIREQMLEAKLAAAANRYIDEVLYRQGGVADALTLDPDYLNSFVRARTNSPDNDETFVRLEFNQQFRDEIGRRYKQFISLDRLWQLGGIAAGILVLLAGFYACLRWMPGRISPVAGTERAAATENIEPAGTVNSPAAAGPTSARASLLSRIRMHPWRFVVGCAVGGALGAAWATLLMHR